MAENDLDVNLLINSMTTEIEENFFYSQLSKRIGMLLETLYLIKKILLNSSKSRALLKSMTTEIGENFLLVSITKEIGMLLETLSLIKKLLLNSSKLRPLLKISNKVIYLLQLTTQLYLAIFNS